MNQRFEEYCHTRGYPLSVDRTGGVLNGVKLLGLGSVNNESVHLAIQRGAVGGLEIHRPWNRGRPVPSVQLLAETVRTCDGAVRHDKTV